MRNFTYISLILLILSCSSPTDVDAERSKSNVKNPDPDALLLVADKINIDFGHVYYAETNSRRLILTNVTGEEYIINEITFQEQPSFFFIENQNFPIKLEPYQSIELNVNCRQTLSGEFKDKLIIDGERAPSVELRSVLPDFQLSYQEEFEFNSGDVGVQIVTVINNSNLPIEISNIYLSGNHSNFFKLEFDPNDFLELNPKQTFKFPIKCNAERPGHFAAKLKFVIFGNGIYEDIAELNAVVTD